MHVAEGLFLAVLIGWLSDEQSKFLMVFFGGFSALFPDIDFLIFLHWKNWKIDLYTLEHRDILHRPLKLSLGGAIILYYLCGFSWVLIWFLNILIHCFHDMFDGWGIRWIPFSEKYFTFESRYPKIVIANKKEHRKILKKYGDHKWFEKESSVNDATIKELLFFLAAFELALLWVLV